MEHIRQFDWCKFVYDPHPENFLEEKDLDNSVTERILRGTFTNPLLSSDDSDDEPLVVNWSRLLNKQKNEKNGPIYVPGIKPVPKYLKISSLTFRQHFSMLRVIVAENPSVLKKIKFQFPNHNDKKIFKECQEIYETEQQEFRNWAKAVWNTGDNIKALKTMPIIEEIYKSEFEIQIHNLTCLQKNYEMAGVIELKHKQKSGCILTHKQDLVKVNISELPQVISPSMDKKYTLYSNKPPLPKICTKHPTKMILPNENGITDLPLNEVYEELSYYAASHNITCIMSENAANKLLEEDRFWTLPLFVRSQVCADGQTRNIKVIGNEIIYRKQPARYRTYNVLQNLVHLQFCINSLKEKKKNIINKVTRKMNTMSKEKEKKSVAVVEPTEQASSSDEEDALVMDICEMGGQSPATEDQPSKEELLQSPPKISRLDDKLEEAPPAPIPSPNLNLERMLTCTCKDSFDPHPRSYKKWRLKNPSAPITDQNMDVIIHCEHKCQMNGHEYLLESIPEYQLQLGGTVQSEQKLRSLALLLHLRDNATLLNVRVDTLTGEVVTTDYLSLSDLSPDQELEQEAAHVLHSALTQLITLLPGDYLLVHEPRHGSNVMLHVARRNPTGGDALTLCPDSRDITDDAEMAELATPPNLGNVFLPFNKFRKILPLAFTHNANLVVKPKETVTKKTKKRKFKKRKINL